MGLHNQTKRCFPPIPTIPAKAGKSQTDHIPATFLRTSMRAGTEVPWVQSHRNHQTAGNRSQYPWGAIKAAQSCRAIATTFRVTSQLSNLHWPGVGISNKNKTILAQDVAYVKLFGVYLMLFRVDLCLIWNYFCILKKENYAQRCCSKTQAYFW